jgi:hypothetical protein
MFSWIVNSMLREQIAKFDLVDPVKIAGQDFFIGASEPPQDRAFPAPAHLMDRLTELTSLYSLDTVFLSNSGANACVRNGPSRGKIDEMVPSDGRQAAPLL